MNIIYPKISKIQKIAKDTTEVTLDLDDNAFDFATGQFLRLTLQKNVTDDPRGNSRDFSIVSLPKQKSLKIAFRTRQPLSGFKKELVSAPIGTQVKISGPHDEMHLDSPAGNLVFIAGGIGITTFAGKINFLVKKIRSGRKIILLYADHGQKEAAYLDELREISKSNPAQFKLITVFGKHIDQKIIGQVKKNYRPKQWQIAGPPLMIDGVLEILKKVGVADNHILHEKYRGYDLPPLNKETTLGVSTLDSPHKNRSLGYLGLLKAVDKQAIISETDLEGTMLYVNDKFVEVSKYSREELIGENHRILKSDYHSPIFYQKIWDSISQGKSWRGEVKNRAKDGTYYWTDASIVPITNRSRETTGFISVRFIMTSSAPHAARFPP